MKSKSRSKSRAKTAVLVALGVVVGGACLPDALQGAKYTGPQNVCTDTCLDDALCINGVCRASTVTPKIVYEVTPPATAHYGAGAIYRFGPFDDPTSPKTLQIDLVRGSILVDARAIPDIAAQPFALDVRLVEHPDDVAALPASALQRYEFQSTATDLDGLGAGMARVSFRVPQGTYDVYVSPVDAGVQTALPPIVRSAESFAASGEHDYVLGNFTTLTLALTDVDEAATALSSDDDAWDVSVVDRASGNVVSTVVTTCGHAGSAQLRLSAGLTQHTYSVRFTMRKTVCPGQSGAVFLRPNYDFDLDAFDVAGTGTGTAHLPSKATIEAAAGKAVPSAVTFGGWVVDALPSSTDAITEPTNGLPATILLRSRSIVTPPDWKTGEAWYATQTGSSAGTDSLPAGEVSAVQVPAGTYDIQLVPDPVAPRSSLFAATILPSRSLAHSLDTSHTYFAPSPKSQVIGTVVGLDGSPFGIGDVDFMPEEDPPSATSMPRVARRGSATVHGVLTTSGVQSCDPTTAKTTPAGALTYNFSAGLDPGLYDVVARVPQSSGFASIVLQQVTVTPPSCTPTVGVVDLDAPRPASGNLRADSPALLSGRVVDRAGDPVAFATVRARAIVGVSPTAAVVVAEAQTDADGKYTLLVAPALHVYKVSPATSSSAD